MLIPMMVMPQDMAAGKSDGTSASCSIANNMALSMGMNMSMMGQPMPFMFAPQPFPHMSVSSSSGPTQVHGHYQDEQKPASTTDESTDNSSNGGQDNVAGPSSSPSLEAMRQAQAQQIQAAMQMQAMQMAYAQSIQNGGSSQPMMWAPSPSCVGAPFGRPVGTDDVMRRRASDATSASEKGNEGSSSRPTMTGTGRHHHHQGQDGNGGSGHSSSAHSSGGNLAHAA